MEVVKIIVSSGPTREWIDPVRFISNASSGKMGFCIAEAASTWTSDVVYIRGLTQEEYSRPAGSRVVSVETTLEMRKAVLDEIGPGTLLIMAAAPADFRPVQSSEAKIKKEEGSEIITLELAKNPDILSSVSEKIGKENISGVVLVGFSAETHNLQEHALGKLKRKNLDYIVGNYVSRDEKGFGDLDTKVVVFGKDGSEKGIGPASKEFVAGELLAYLKSR